MPYQNRVTPRGERIVTSARGLLMGNRGILHDEHTIIRRNHVGKRWIICDLHGSAPPHPIMQPNVYTHLFFLDEATALAAGHRPCALCRRTHFVDFRTRWVVANPDLCHEHPVSADMLDRVLHAERITGNYWSGWRKRTYDARLGDLPDGTFVTLPDNVRPYLVYQDSLHPWDPAGYGEPRVLERELLAQVLTPPSVVNTLHHGYRPVLHPSLPTQ